MKQKLINIYKNMNLQKTTLLLYWALSVIVGDRATQTVSFVGLLIMWYIDNKERKPKEEFTLNIDGRDIVKGREFKFTIDGRDIVKESYKDLSLKLWAKIDEYETNPSEELYEEIIELDKQINELGEQIFNYDK